MAQQRQCHEGPVVSATLAEVGLLEERKVARYSVKVPVFPFDRFRGFDPVLGPEMRSTGEAYGAIQNLGSHSPKR